MTQSATPVSTVPALRPRRGPLQLALDIASSVRVGIVLMTILFVYCTIGSAGIVVPTRGEADFTLLGIPFQHQMVRQWRAFELTEFEWFHTPFFNALIALICVNIIFATVRRIRLSVINLGVWMIHSGIIILALGSVVYFGTKVEGDAPVIRRDVVIRAPGVAEPVRLPALLGSSIAVMGEGGEYRFRVDQIDPQWELRSGDDVGKTAFGVAVSVTTPTQSFVRQLLAGFPEYTEDVIPGKGRVKKLEEFAGQALVDESIRLSLEPRAATEFWIKDTAALYVRGVTERQWAMRPIEGLPRYNEYVSEPARDLWLTPAAAALDGAAAKGLDITVPPGERPDPLAGSQVRITGFLRYAVMQRGWKDGGDQLNPMIDITLRDSTGERIGDETLLAFDPMERSRFGGRMVFDWITDPAQLQAYEHQQQRALVIRVPGTGDALELPLSGETIRPDAPLTPIGESGFAYRVVDVVDQLPLSDGSSVSLVRVEIQTPDSKFIRWVFEDPSRNRDNAETAVHEPHRVDPPDPRIETVYRPGSSARLTIVAGPGEIGLRAISRDDTGSVVVQQFSVGETISVVDGLVLKVNRLLTHAQAEQRPVIIPWQQRDKDADAAQLYALVQVEISGGGRTERRWVPFHRYAFNSRAETPPSLSRYEPALFTLADGRTVELIVSRQRMPLPNPVILDDFVLTTHVGGYSGRVTSVRDWTSVVRFQHEGGLSEPIRISTNDPGQFEGLWFFQSYWDPPQPGRGAGLAFTGLGVGNRNGVYIQLLGCCISVAGMLYAFYVKPIIRRRRKEAALAMHAARVEANGHRTRDEAREVGS